MMAAIISKKVVKDIQASVILPNGQELPLSLSVKESWQTREGLRVRARLGCPEKDHKAFPNLSVKLGTSLDGRFEHQASVCVDSPLRIWEWNVELIEQGFHVVALFSHWNEGEMLAAFEFDFESLVWKQVK